MSDAPSPSEESSPEQERANQSGNREFRQSIREKEERKLRKKQSKRDSIWFGLGVWGLVGWSVSVPTLIGAGVGIWIDRRWPSSISWTLTGLVIGIAVGCFTAWQWISRERKQIHEPLDEQQDDHE